MACNPMMPISRRTRCRSAKNSDRGRYAAIWRLPKKGYLVNTPSISCINSIVARSTSTGVEQIEDRLILSCLHWRVRLRSIFSLRIIPRRSPSHRYCVSTAGQWTGSGRAHHSSPCDKKHFTLRTGLSSCEALWSRRPCYQPS